MYRIDRKRLDQADFRFHTEVATRFDDLDLQGHINNVAVGALLQEGRARFNQQVMKAEIEAGQGMVVGNIFIEYAAPLFVPQPVTIATGVIEIGRSSYGIAQLMRQDGKPAVYAETTMVMVQRGRGPTPINDAGREALEALRTC